MTKRLTLAFVATVALLSVAHGFSRTAVGRVSSNRPQQRPLAASFTGDDNLQDKNKSRPFFAKPAEQQQQQQQQGPSTSGTPSNRMKPPLPLSTNNRNDSRLNGKQQQGAAANKEPNYYLSNWRSEPKTQTQSQQQSSQQQRQLGSWSRAAVPTPPNQVAVAPPRRDPFARPQQEQQSRDQPRRVVAPSFARAPVPPPPQQPQVPARQAQIPQPRQQRQRQQRQVQQQPPRQQQVQQQVQQPPRSYARSDTRYRTKPYGDTYSLFSFVAYLQASFVSCFTGGLAAAPFLFYHWYAYAPTSYTMAAQVEYDLGAALLSAFLFGGVYRYCVRDDVQNATLKDRVTWAFVLVRSLVRIEVPMECAAGGVHVAPGVDLPLACADPLPFANYGMLSDFAMNFCESAALFGVAAVVLNGLLDSNYIRRFPG